jgi:hypothetical protein
MTPNELRGTLKPLAWRIALQYKASVGEIFGRLILACYELDSERPGFLDQKAAYIRQGAKWRVLKDLVRERRLAVVELPGGGLGRLAAPPPHVADDRPCWADLVGAVRALDGELSDIANVVLDDPARFVCGSHLNASEIARALDRGEWWVRARLPWLRLALASECS